MKIYLVRHTRTAAPDGMCYGQTDVPLPDGHREEFQRLRATWGKTFDGAAHFASPLSRCRILAESLAQSASITFDERLKELHFGDWEGRLWQTLPRLETTRWLENFAEQRCPNGESFGDLEKRLLSFWDELGAMDHSKVLIVTHSGIIRAVLARLLAIPYDKLFSLEIDYGSVSAIEVDKERSQVLFVNRI